MFAAGNSYWVNLDRARVREFYSRVLEAFPDGARMPAVRRLWRVAWTAYLDRKPEAADLIEAYVTGGFRLSSYVPDALYWLGPRSYERSGKPGARPGGSICCRGRPDFPLTYFGEQAAGAPAVLSRRES